MTLLQRTNRPSLSVRLACLILGAGLLPASAASSGTPALTLTPFKATGIYAAGETVGWTVTAAPGEAAPSGLFTYAVRMNGADVCKSGTIDLAPGQAKIAFTFPKPAMFVLEISPKDGTPCAVGGAALDPASLRPVAPRPADFDAFWDAKVKALETVPANPVLTSGDSGQAGVAYWTIRMDNIGDAHIYGQLARPAREGKYPAMLVLQWASPPYPLQKSWVTAHAAAGWLVLNVEPHDVPADMPAPFYAALPALIRHYEGTGNIDRDRSYFLRMYLGDYRAVDYLASRPDWDGRTLVVTGTSMGGQQSLCVAGLHPKVTHVVVNEPAGCDALAALHGRAASYPNWDISDPRVVATAPYFDAVNFAPRIKARSLVAIGFVDETARPAGIWTAFNLIAGPKEPAPMIDSPHNNHATAAQQRPWTERSAAWFAALALGEEPRAVEP